MWRRRKNVSENERVVRCMVATVLLKIVLMEEGRLFWLLLPAAVSSGTG